MSLHRYTLSCFRRLSRTSGSGVHPTRGLGPGRPPPPRGWPVESRALGQVELSAKSHPFQKPAQFYMNSHAPAIGASAAMKIPCVLCRHPGSGFSPLVLPGHWTGRAIARGWGPGRGRPPPPDEAPVGSRVRRRKSIDRKDPSIAESGSIFIGNDMKPPKGATGTQSEGR